MSVITSNTTNVRRISKRMDFTEKKHLVSDEPPGQPGFQSERRRKNLKILINNTSLIPFKWRGRYMCFYCGETYTEYTEFIKHTKSHGDCTTADYSLKKIKGNSVEVKVDVSDAACKICNEPFACVADIIDHLILKHGLQYDRSVNMLIQEYRLADFKCLFCEQQFSYFGNLICHVNIAHPQNCFICDDCGATFNKKRDMANHLRVYHRFGGYPCDRCTKVFETQRLLKVHQRAQHFRKCNFCSYGFGSNSLLQKHIRLDHPDGGSNKCSYCNKECLSKLSLSQHLSKCKVKMVAGKIGEDPFVSQNASLKPKQNVAQIRENILCVLNMSTAIPFKFFSKYSCFFCSKAFIDYEYLKEHTLREHPSYDVMAKCIKKCRGERTTVKIDVNGLACKLCGLPMSDLNSLIDHLIDIHNANYDKSITGCLEPFSIIKDNMPCPVCSQVFRYFGNLLRHINSEHSDNNSICNFCGRSFKNVANLNVHISYAHTGAVDCDICYLKFKNQWCLSRHKAKSHDAKEFRCPKCPELFSSQYHKQKHLIKTHNVGHKCSYCGRMFTRNSFMKDHIRRTHLKEKNVPCSVCNERFFDNYLLKLHMVKHEGERKFTCTVCGKAFLRRSNLCSHMEMHKKYGHVALGT